jgi:hypothetical protein
MGVVHKLLQGDTSREVREGGNPEYRFLGDKVWHDLHAAVIII